MKRTLTLAAVALALLPAVAVGGGAAAQAAAPATEAPQVFVTNFDDDSARNLWKAGGDATNLQTLDRATGENGCAANSAIGAYGALRSFDHANTRQTAQQEAERPDPVATWAQAGFAVQGGGPVEVAVMWSARNVKYCENCTLAAYAGNSPAKAGGNFDLVGELGNGWQRFRYDTHVDLIDSNRLFVALGWMGGDATVGLDCVTVSVAKTRTAPADRSAPPLPVDGAAPPPSGQVGAPPPPPDTTVGEDTAGRGADARQPGGNYYYNFEDGLAPWRFGTDGTYGSLQQQFGQNGCPDLRGNAFASVSNIAGPLRSHDLLDLESLMIPPPLAPAMYMAAPFTAARAAVSHVEVDWVSKAIDNCDGCMQLAYVGDSSRPNTADFSLLAGGLGSEWEATHYEIDLKAEPGSTIFVALGWQGTGEQAGLDKPELPSNAGYDCVSVRIQAPDN